MRDELNMLEASLSSLQDEFVAEIKRHETEVEQLQRARMESDVEWKAVVSQMQSEAERVVQQMQLEAESVVSHVEYGAGLQFTALQETRKECMDLSEHTAELQARLDSGRDEVMAVRSELSESRAQHEAERSALESELEWLKAEERASSSALGVSASELSAMRHELATCESERADLDREVAARESELEMRMMEHDAELTI